MSGKVKHLPWCKTSAERQRFKGAKSGPGSAAATVLVQAVNAVISVQASSEMRGWKT